MSVGVTEITDLPDKLILYDTYLNPFVSHVVIKFGIPQVGSHKPMVTLNIYDITGNKAVSWVLHSRMEGDDNLGRKGCKRCIFL